MASEPFADWEKHPDGSIKTHPVVGWDLFVPFGMACGLRVHYVTSPDQLARGTPQFLPLVLQPAQARELAEALLRTADRAVATPGKRDD